MRLSNLDSWLKRTRQRLPAKSILHWQVERESRTLWLDKIMLPKQARKGAGSMLLARILEQADRAGATVELNANPTGQPEDPGTEDLVRWYGRFGFEVLSEDQDGVQMRRNPQSVQPWERLLAKAKDSTRTPMGSSRKKVALRGRPGLEP